MVLGVLVGVGLAIGGLVWWVLARWPAADAARPGGAPAAVAREIAEAEPAQSFLRARVDPQVATGLVLTLAAGIVLLGGAALALLAFAVRSGHSTVRLDRGVATWADTHATPFTTHVLEWVTFLGSTVAVIVLTAAVFAFVRLRRHAPWSVATFLVVVVAGQNLIANVVKAAVDRARPDIHPLAGFSGPSFPSGHTTAAFACFGACAIVLGRGRSRASQRTWIAVAMGLASMVGVSRVMLGVHWLTDVLGGAALGLAWLALVTVAFGGRLMRFGAPVEAAERATDLAAVDRSDP